VRERVFFINITFTFDSTVWLYTFTLVRPASYFTRAPVLAFNSLARIKFCRNKNDYQDNVFLPFASSVIYGSIC